MKTIGSVVFNFLFIVLSGAYILANMAQYSGYERFGISHLLSLGYIFIFFGLLIFLVTYLIRKKWVFAGITFLLILVSSGNWSRQIGLKFGSTPADQSLKILTYNTCSFSGLDGEEHFGEFIKWLQKSSSYDIIVLQEIIKSEYKTLSNKLEGFDHHFYTARGHDGSGVALFSRNNLMVKKTFDFEYPGNQAIVADIEIDNQTSVRIVGVHFSSNRLSSEANALFDQVDQSSNEENWNRVQDILKLYYKGSKARVTDLDKIQPYVEDSELPLILAGDFNDTPFSPFYYRINQWLSDGFMQAGQGFGGTYKGKLKGLRIDYIFTSDHFKTNRYKTINLPFSDHKAVESIVSLNKK